MAQRKQYQVVAPYITLKTMTPDGVRIMGFNEGASVPDDVPPDQIEHHLSTGQIVEVPSGAAMTLDEEDEAATAAYQERARRARAEGDRAVEGGFEPGVPQHIAQDANVNQLALNAPTGGAVPAQSGPRGTRTTRRTTAAEVAGAQPASESAPEARGGAGADKPKNAGGAGGKAGAGGKG